MLMCHSEDGLAWLFGLWLGQFGKLGKSSSRGPSMPRLLIPNRIASCSKPVK